MYALFFCLTHATPFSGHTPGRYLFRFPFPHTPQRFSPFPLLLKGWLRRHFKAWEVRWVAESAVSFPPLLLPPNTGSSGRVAGAAILRPSLEAPRCFARPRPLLQGAWDGGEGRRECARAALSGGFFAEGACAPRGPFGRRACSVLHEKAPAFCLL